MEQIEQTQQTITAAQAQLKESEALFVKERQWGRKDRVLAAELAELEKKQAQLSGQVEKGLFARYSKLKAIRKEPALVLVKDGIASVAGCSCLPDLPS